MHLPCRRVSYIEIDAPSSAMHPCFGFMAHGAAAMRTAPPGAAYDTVRCGLRHRLPCGGAVPNIIIPCKYSRTVTRKDFLRSAYVAREGCAYKVQYAGESYSSGNTRRRTRDGRAELNVASLYYGFRRKNARRWHPP